LSTSDWINLSIAIIAGIAAILTMININVMIEQNKEQKKQWEFSYVPVFRIAHTTAIDSSEYILLIENMNNTQYRLESISFSRPNVTTSFQNHGEIILNKTGSEPEKFQGLQVTLEPEDYMGLVGHFTLKGTDALGNSFLMESKEIHFDHYELNGDIDTTNSYLTKA